VDVAAWRGQAARARHTDAELAAYDVVRAGTPVLGALLADPGPDVRAAAAYTLAAPQPLAQ
jgi:hypothetical protein